MTFAQYLKIETSLGGIGCTDKQFIQACLDYILPQAKHHNIYRKARHSFGMMMEDYILPEQYLNRSEAQQKCRSTEHVKAYEEEAFDMGPDDRQQAFVDQFDKVELRT